MAVTQLNPEAMCGINRWIGIDLAQSLMKVKKSRARRECRFDRYARKVDVTRSEALKNSQAMGDHQDGSGKDGQPQPPAIRRNPGEPAAHSWSAPSSPPVSAREYASELQPRTLSKGSADAIHPCAGKASLSSKPRMA